MASYPGNIPLMSGQRWPAENSPPGNVTVSTRTVEIDAVSKGAYQAEQEGECVCSPRESFPCGSSGGAPVLNSSAPLGMQYVYEKLHFAEDDARPLKVMAARGLSRSWPLKEDLEMAWGCLRSCLGRSSCAYADRPNDEYRDTRGLDGLEMPQKVIMCLC